MLSRLHTNRGVILIAIGAVATLWLGATSQLSLYIHPRYTLFSMVMSTLGLLVAVWSVSKRTGPFKKRHVSSALLLVIVFVLFLVIKPAILTSNTVNQRGINTASNTDSLAKLANGTVVSPFGNRNFELSVKDWAGLLSQTNDQAFFAGKKTTLEGFISKDESGSADIFYVSRFIVSCCAVDARPVGVPVYKQNWQSDFTVDQWVTVSGSFKSEQGRIVLQPTALKAIAQPKDPYVY